MRWPIVLSSVLGTAFALPAYAQVFSDQSFQDSDWTVVTLVDETYDQSATCTGQHLAVGGNPDAYRAVSNQWSHDGSGSVSVVAGHLRTQADYDPAVDGAIGAIAYALDGYTDSTTYPLEAAITFSPVLVQGDGTYIAPGGLETGVSWASYQGGPWTADDFTLLVGTAPNHPDFSASGGPVTFGVAARSGPHSLAGVYTTYGGLDNWQVTITDPSELPDAGTDGGTESDAGPSGSPAGPSGVTPPPGTAPPREDEGCAVTQPRRGRSWWLGLLALGALSGRRRRPSRAS